MTEWEKLGLRERLGQKHETKWENQQADACFYSAGNNRRVGGNYADQHYIKR